MNKGDLIDAIAEKTGLKKFEASAALDATLESIQESLEKGEKVTLVGFCTFSTVYNAARNGVNPSTRHEGKIKSIKIPEKVKVKFKAGKQLADAVNSNHLLKKFKS